MVQSMYFLSSCVLLFFLLGSANAQSPSAAGGLHTLAALPERSQAPDFKLIDTRDKVYTLSAYHGQVVLVNFWASWCEPCRKEMPSLQRAWEKLRAQGVLVLAVNWGDDAPTVDKFLQEVPVDFPILLGWDDEMIARWSIQGLPTTFIIDPQGRLAYRVAGELEWDDPQILDKVLALKEKVDGK